VKKHIHQIVIVVIAVVRLVKLIVGITSTNPYAINDVTTFAISSFIIGSFLFVASDKLYKISIVMLLVSNTLDYMAIFMPGTKIAFSVVSILATFTSICFVILSIQKTRKNP
jgi:hypothetical protein